MSLISFGQEKKPVSTIDFVKVLNDRHPEAIFYYENNWKVYRDMALERGYILSYQLIKTSADSIADFNLVLVTEYADSLQLKNSEENFQKIIKEVRPNGPRLLNDLQPKDFRHNLYLKRAETIFAPGPKPTMNKN